MSAGPKIERLRAGDLLDDSVPTQAAPTPRPRRARVLGGVALAAAGLPLLTLLLSRTHGTLSLEGQVVLYLAAVVVIALVGGMVIALLSAVAAALLINYYFVAPTHTLTIAHADQATALIVFVAVAAVVSGAVELAGRRARAAEQASEQAETLAALARASGEDSESLHAILRRARESFGMESVALKERDAASGEWVDVDTAGWAPVGQEAPLRFDLPAGKSLRLVGRGPAIFAEDQRVLRAFAGAAQSAYEAHRLSERADHAKALAAVDRQRTALLAAVGHDLRTPLAAVKAAVSSLRQTDVTWSEAERLELLATIEESTDRLDAVVRNLLDASRLQAGMLTVRAEPISLDEAVTGAVLAVPEAAGRVDARIAEDLPMLQADPGLLERIIVNLLDNAIRYDTSGEPITIRARAGAESVKIEIVDHGPGVSQAEQERLFQPFQRLDDRNTNGIGLGLSVARGFTEAMGGALVADRTAGGGLTMRLRLPLAVATRGGG